MALNPIELVVQQASAPDPQNDPAGVRQLIKILQDLQTTEGVYAPLSMDLLDEYPMLRAYTTLEDAIQDLCAQDGLAQYSRKKATFRPH